MFKLFSVIVLFFIAISISSANPLLLTKVGAGAKVAKKIKLVKPPKVVKTKKQILRKARKIIYSKIPNKTGIYRFKDKSGKQYIGKAQDQTLKKRIQQHMLAGKLPVKNGKTVSSSVVSKKNVDKWERKVIKAKDTLTKGNLANSVHAPMSRLKRMMSKK